MKAVWDILTAPQVGTKTVRWFGKSPTRNLGGMCGHPDQLASVAHNLRDYDLYVTLNPTLPRVTKRISGADVTHCAFILIDLDPVGSGGGVQAPSAAVSVLHGRLSEEVHPSLCAAAGILTGRGAQLWVRMQPQDVGVGGGQRDYWPNCIRNFLTHIAPLAPPGWRVDMTADLARIARMPGTVNHRTHQTGKLWYPGKIIDNPSFYEFLRGFYREIPLMDPIEQSATWTKDWRDAWEDLTFGAKNFITFGARSGDRHVAAWKTAKSLHECGVSRGSALEALLYGNESCESPLTKREIVAKRDEVYDKEKR